MICPNPFRGLYLFAIVVLVGACSGENLATIRNIRSSGQAIICFGDSLTEGVGAGSGEDYPSILSRQLGSPVINAGVRGDTTAAALARLDGEVLTKNPRLVIVLLGGNDFLRQQPRGETRRNLEEIVHRVQAQGAMVVIAGIKLGLFGDDYGEIFEQTAKRFDALYIPQVMKGIFTDASLRSDSIRRKLVGSQIGPRQLELPPLMGQTASAGS